MSILNDQKIHSMILFSNHDVVLQTHQTYLSIIIYRIMYPTLYSCIIEENDNLDIENGELAKIKIQIHTFHES